MSKLDEIKQKLSGFREKLPKLAFLSSTKKEKAKSYSIGEIYKTGDTFTRLQVIVAALLMIAALVSAGIVGKRLWTRLGDQFADDKNKKKYAEEFAELANRAARNASIVSIGTVTVNSYTKNGDHAFLNMDIWVRVSDMDASNFVNKNEMILNDTALTVLNELFQNKISILSENGKQMARDKMLEKLNKVIPKGRVEEVFFHNLVLQ